MTRSNRTKTSSAPDPLLEAPTINRALLDETTFRRMIAIERKRTERSKAPFVLMLLEASGSDYGLKKSGVTLSSVATALLASSRDTDLVGWYKNDDIVGTIFTGLTVIDKRAGFDTFLTKVSASLSGTN